MNPKGYMNKRICHPDLGVADIWLQFSPNVPFHNGLLEGICHP